MTEVAHVLGWNPVRGETKSGSWETEGENALRGCRSTGIDRYELIGSSQHPYGAGAVIIPILQMRLSDLFKATQLASGGSQVPWGRLGPLPTAWPPGGLGARGSAAVSPGPRSPGVAMGQLVTTLVGTWRPPPVLHHSCDEGVKEWSAADRSRGTGRNLKNQLLWAMPFSQTDRST